jgi:hypothetical protein
VAELGNIPNPEFSDLLDEGKGQYASTEQQRSMLAKYDNPGRRTRGLVPAFSEKGNLSEFAELFNQDLFETGSAVSAHLPNPRDRMKPQLNILKQHALFPNLTEARKLAEEQYTSMMSTMCARTERMSRSSGTHSKRSCAKPLTD